MQSARFPLMHMIDAKLCYHLMFQNSFRNIERQNIYCKFLDDRLELWPSISLKWIGLNFSVDRIALSHRICVKGPLETYLKHLKREFKLILSTFDSKIVQIILCNITVK